MNEGGLPCRSTVSVIVFKNPWMAKALFSRILDLGNKYAVVTEIRERAKTVIISCNAWFRNAKQPRRSQEIKFCYMTSISPGWNRTAQHTITK